jgi:uncharacterized protein with gpF-like domain
LKISLSDIFASDAVKQKKLRPARANIGIQFEYYRKLESLISEMETSTIHWLSASYRKAPPIAVDEMASSVLREALKKLIRRWNKNFDEMSAKLAKYFATAINKRSDAVLKKILKDGGFAVDFKMTDAMREVFNAAVNENVSLIKSIPRQCLTQVEGYVMRSVETGRDLGQLTKDLRRQFQVTKKRAALIARDQNNKCTATFSRVRQLEVGITEGIWVHSGGGKEPRPSHLKAGRDQVRFKIKEGWYDPDEERHILPGELINCRCTWKPVVKGFS